MPHPLLPFTERVHLVYPIVIHALRQHLRSLAKSTAYHDTAAQTDVDHSPYNLRAAIIAASAGAALMFLVVGCLLFWAWLRQRRRRRLIGRFFRPDSRPYTSHRRPREAQDIDVRRHIDLMLEILPPQPLAAARLPPYKGSSGEPVYPRFTVPG
ncbi:hypothetical protein EXIGLDRAFT_471270 [Exidia glandulosa HHB12029]|uniref:Uncharacterized protein n=1 Tax=Exidia glandulosa HHB12029 TaxID=1314781 RepID=A0A165AU90_EXIGL|nr:hypothetical protein EXIGLDRAFT_471270 [Exidia glandulosa HHB12029]